MTEKDEGRITDIRMEIWSEINSAITDYVRNFLLDHGEHEELVNDRADDIVVDRCIDLPLDEAIDDISEDLFIIEKGRGNFWYGLPPLKR